jgi:L-2,4-diaminobutyric acid acetyltransferase
MHMNQSDQIEPRWPGLDLRIRMPEASDGTKVWNLIADSGVLDLNSLYCNLLQCSHFAATCALAEMDGKTVGWMSGYKLPDRPDTLFVWQVCVADVARGRGLAHNLIMSVLARPECAGVRHVECTITEANAASWALFRGVARGLDATVTSQPQFLRDAHLDSQHDSEIRVTIGPFAAHGPHRAKAA